MVFCPPQGWIPEGQDREEGTGEREKLPRARDRDFFGKRRMEDAGRDAGMDGGMEAPSGLFYLQGQLEVEFQGKERKNLGGR